MQKQKVDIDVENIAQISIVANNMVSQGFSKLDYVVSYGVQTNYAITIFHFVIIFTLCY